MVSKKPRFATGAHVHIRCTATFSAVKAVMGSAPVRVYIDSFDSSGIKSSSVTASLGASCISTLSFSTDATGRANDPHSVGIDVLRD